ncbi:hypothetical protein [Hyphomicrobium sp. CS1GBMeth3]|uniref:hypothetical protein n=1 Tax=Hyphomicrobium sp. CS1GBMeth3 TaxID=1892845 RepID=UPI001114ED87|nr:hypothetical protein [Hyphomicrobium sp. CS1GBMeth3]
MTPHGCGRKLAAAVLLGAALAAGGEAPAQPKQQPAAPECLNVAQSSAATYVISNTVCPDESVLASIELANGRDLARCFVKKIRTQISIASEGAAPVINYQCIEGATGCSVEIVRDMFPECHAG